MLFVLPAKGMAWGPDRPAANISGFAAKYISLHAGIGINFSGFDMGVAFHLPMRSRHVTLYGGTDLSYVDRNGVIFLPVGGRYIFCNGISVGMEVLPGADTDGEYILWGSFKIGYFFRRKY